MADKKKFMNDKRMNSNILRLYRVIGYVFLILAPIVFVDYYVDSYASFRITYNKIGKASVQSNYCVGEEIPLSERKAKWAKINHMDSVEYMILGSSRSLMFSSENLKISSFYNLGVSGGVLLKIIWRKYTFFIERKNCLDT